jgi:hypothetical protein
MQFTQDSSRIKLAGRVAVETVTGEAGPKLGEVAELLRSTISKEYGIVPPNLNTALDPAGTSMTIMAVDRTAGLNLSIVISDLNPPTDPAAAQQPPAPGGMPAPGGQQPPAPGGMPAPQIATPPGGMPQAPAPGVPVQ